MRNWKSGFNTCGTLLLAGVLILATDHKVYGTTQHQHGRAIAAVLVVAFAAQALVWVVFSSRKRRQARRQPVRRQPVRDLWP
jgi:Na+/melibiose symporter-like transporter